MRKVSLSRCLSAMAAVAVLAGGAATMAQTDRRSVPPRRVPQPRIQNDPALSARPTESRDLLNLVEDLENSTPEEIRTGRIGRYFTDPAVIITNGRMHRVDWRRITDDRLDERDRRDQDDRVERGNDAAAAPRQDDVRVEGFQTRRIDPRTVVVLYTAVIPDREGAVRQPVVATLIRESGSGWRVASYTAENAAIPGGVDVDEDRLPPLPQGRNQARPAPLPRAR
jgi:hypothetical protein